MARELGRPDQASLRVAIPSRDGDHVSHIHHVWTRTIRRMRTGPRPVCSLLDDGQADVVVDLVMLQPGRGARLWRGV